MLTRSCCRSIRDRPPRFVSVLSSVVASRAGPESRVSRSSALHLSTVRDDADRQVPLLRACWRVASTWSGASAESSAWACGVLRARRLRDGHVSDASDRPRGVYGNPILPDFMVFLNWKELPWFWLGFNHFRSRC
jgi:hypothetical protein